MGDFEKRTYYVVRDRTGATYSALRAPEPSYSRGDIEPPGQKIEAYTSEEAIALVARGMVTQTEILVPLSREAMVGFLGLGHPHSATWFAELKHTFEEMTGEKMSDKFSDEPRVFTAKEMTALVMAMARAYGHGTTIMAHVNSNKELTPDSAKAIEMIVRAAYNEMLIGE